MNDDLKIIIGILSYNMPHLTDALFQQLKSLVTVLPVEYIIFDNGSDQDKIAKSTTNRLEKNTRLTGGLNEILRIAKEKDPSFVMLCTNDIKFEYQCIDPIYDMIHKMSFYFDMGVLHPSLVKPIPDYAYPWMVKIPDNQNKTGFTVEHTMVDQICPMYSRDALEAINWKFDTRFEYGWGIDYDSCFQIRKAGLKIAVDFDVLVSHQTSAVYDSGNDKEFKNRQEYYKRAGENMQKGMKEKYGDDWVTAIGGIK